MTLPEVTLYSLDPIERGGFTFKVSSNNYDGGVLVVTTSNIFKYSSIKYFSNPKSARKWCDDLVNLTDSVCRELFKK